MSQTVVIGNAPGMAHRWRIEQDDTVVLTVRWPSLAGDTQDGPG